MKESITNKELKKATEILNKIDNYYQQRIIGQAELKQSLLTALMANGHLLLESVPGLAKTTAAKVITESCDGKFMRIQCTPDLLPSDIIGTQIFNYSTNEFETKLGPINANFVLLDEINRTNSKTQSATLEAMEERKITIDKTTYNLPEIFIVIATQNPIEQEGTYYISEAQLDRFLLKEKINYLNTDEEVKMLDIIDHPKTKNTKPVVSLNDLKYLQTITDNVYVDQSIKEYIVDIVDATRNPHKFIDQKYSDYIELGSSPRGAIAFMKCAKAHAIIKGRKYVTPDDVKDLKYKVLRHRIILSYEALAENISVEDIIDEIFKGVPTPWITSM